jgi:hypothetical protein
MAGPGFLKDLPGLAFAGSANGLVLYLGSSGTS